MKKIIIYLTTLSLFLLFGHSIMMAQSNNEIKFKLLDDPLITDKNLVTVKVVINVKQQVSSDGIHFTLIIKNNSRNVISTKNIANMLRVSLFDERGLDISVPNDALNDVKINRRPEERQWKFRSQSVIVDKVYLSGVEDKRNIKMQEYIEIPARGEWKVNLVLKNVKQVETPRDVSGRTLKPTISLPSGKYKLIMWLSIFSKDQNRLIGLGRFESPMIDINYGN